MRLKCFYINVRLTTEKEYKVKENFMTNKINPFPQLNYYSGKPQKEQKSNVVDPTPMSTKDLLSKDGKFAQELKEAKNAGIRQAILDLFTPTPAPSKAELEHDAAQKPPNIFKIALENDSKNNLNRGLFSTEDLRGK